MKIKHKETDLESNLSRHLGHRLLQRYHCGIFKTDPRGILKLESSSRPNALLLSSLAKNAKEKQIKSMSGLVPLVDF